MNKDSTDSLQLEVNKGRDLSDNLIILYFLMLGGTCNIAWNATLNSLDYFKTAFPSFSVVFVFPLAIYTAQMLSMFVITKISSLFSYQVRVLFCLVLNSSIMLFISLAARIFENTMFGMCFVMFIIFCIGFLNNICYATAAGFASKIEPRFTVYLLIGVSFFGFVASGLKIAVLWIFNPSSDDDLVSTFVFYVLITFIFAGTLLLHIKFMRSEFFRSKSLSPDESKATGSSESRLIDGSSLSIERPQRDLGTLYTVFLDIKLYLILLLILYIQMDVSYPGVMLKKPMPSMADHTKTVTLMLTFALFLFSGKKLAQYREHYNKYALVWTIMLRFALVAFFIIQAVTLSIPIFNTEWFGYLNVALFGLSMGFCSASIFILSAEQVIGEKKEISGFLCVFTINVGAIFGGASSLLLKDIGPPQ